MQNKCKAEQARAAPEQSCVSGARPAEQDRQNNAGSRILPKPIYAILSYPILSSLLPCLRARHGCLLMTEYVHTRYSFVFWMTSLLPYLSLPL